MRLHQWPKNFFVLLPLFFVHDLFVIDELSRTLFGTFSFCLASSAVYIINDIADRNEDRNHPKKKKRPIASGEINFKQAMIAFVLCLIISFSVSAMLPIQFIGFLISYFLLNLLYNIGLKNVAILDALIISLGFLLRVFAGGSISNIPISNWLVAITFFLSLLIAFGKRRDDLIINNPENSIRKSLDGYKIELVNGLIWFCSILLFALYVAYTLSAETQNRIHQPWFVCTAIPAAIGIAFYLYETFKRKNSGDPFVMLYRNFKMQIIIGIWLCMILWFLYF